VEYCSKVDVFLFVVDFGVEWIEVSYQGILFERNKRRFVVWSDQG